MAFLLLHMLFATAALAAGATLMGCGREAAWQMRGLCAELAAGGAPVVVSFTIRASGASASAGFGVGLGVCGPGARAARPGFAATTAHGARVCAPAVRQLPRYRLGVPAARAA